jgi:uncharacterized heparinase superfamily protein
MVQHTHCCLYQILNGSLYLAWRKARRKVRNQAKRVSARWQARWLRTGVSDADLLRALDDRFPMLQTFLSHLRSGEEAPRFFIDPDERRALMAAMRTAHSQAESLTVAAADRACAHVFDLLGSDATPLGEHIDWHMDFKTGHRFDPRRYYADIRPAPYPGGYDIKVPWELSRSQHFTWLGQAYWFTGDEKYAREFVTQVLDWIAQNPPQFGVNWACTMDVAIRAVNWLWGYYFFQDSPALTDEFRLAFFKSLLVHGRHMMDNLEWSEVLTSNHYLADIVGLVYLGILCPEFKEAARWRELGLRELWNEMHKQVYADGVDFEASISYHRLALELFLSPIILCQLNDISVPGETLERLERMIEFVMYYTKPDGTAPTMGDADNGRLHRLKVWAQPEQEWLDHRYLLAIGAVLFERVDFARAAGDQWEEACWLLGERAVSFRERLDRQGQSAALASQAFPDGGVYVMRHDEAYMIVDVGSNGQNGIGGHAHNDTSSFELYAGGRTWIVDPGSYAYTSDFDARNQFRSSAYHNVLTIDGCEINRIDEGSLFRLANDALPTVHVWDTSQDRDLLVISHNGYERLRPSAFHRRLFWLDKRIGSWLICDDVRSDGRHTFVVLFHFAPVQIELGDSMARATSQQGDSELLLYFRGWPAGAQMECLPGWVSDGYGRRARGPVLSIQGAFEAHLRLIHFLLPCRPGERLSLGEVDKALQGILGEIAAVSDA